jgi:hypothetical protein
MNETTVLNRIDIVRLEADTVIHSFDSEDKDLNGAKPILL